VSGEEEAEMDIGEAREASPDEHGRCGVEPCGVLEKPRPVADLRVAQRFFAEVNRQGKKFMSDEHFTVDGTLIQAWALQKSFRSKDDSDDDDGANFHGQKRSNKTHESTTDRDARLYKKSYGKESKLSYRQVARSGESRFAVRLQLRRSQPAAPPRNSNSYHQTLPR
jgi:hypothetical protein